MKKHLLSILLLLILSGFGCSQQKQKADEYSSGELKKYLEKRIDLPVKTVAVPEHLASKLFQEMIDYGNIDVENEYNKEVIAKGKSNPSILFTGENVDLNNDGVPELIVYPSGSEGACTSHNCPFWLFQKNANEYNEILYGIAGVFGYFTVNVTSNGFYDITLIQHSSAVEHEYEVYSFDGNRYQQTKCITAKASEDAEGNVTSSYNEHSCYDEVGEHAYEKNFITGVFKDFEIGDYIHAVFITEDSLERSFWLPQDETIEKLLSNNKGGKFEIFFSEQRQFIPEAGDTITIEMIESVEKLGK